MGHPGVNLNCAVQPYQRTKNYDSILRITGVMIDSLKIFYIFPMGVIVF